MLTQKQDACGRAMYDWSRGVRGLEIIEYDDGFIGPTAGPACYFAEIESWPEAERRALQYATGSVLDVGCGAGRVGLELAKLGHNVVGIDTSPLAVRVARERGMRASIVALSQITPKLGVFDTVVLMGNNFGLFGSAAGAKRMLERLYRWMPEGGRILTSSCDPHRWTTPENRAYERRNRQRGRMSGQIRNRVRYRGYATPWFDYLFVSPIEMQGLVEGTGWRIRRFLHSKREPGYVAVIDKNGASSG